MTGSHILKTHDCLPSLAGHRRAARRAARRLLILAVVAAAIGMAVDGQRWLLQHESAQSIEYTAAACAADALYGEQGSALAAACAIPGASKGKSL